MLLSVPRKMQKKCIYLEDTSDCHVNGSFTMLISPLLLAFSIMSHTEMYLFFD